MATIKHISSKNADYGAAEAYLTFEHDEFTMKPTLDEAGRLIPRQDYRLDTLNCGDEDFALSCIRANLRYGKNSKREDIKSHHYIISFDPRDAADNGLTVDRAQMLGLAYCKEHFPGHQALVCTHPDGHNHSGNMPKYYPINEEAAKRAKDMNSFSDYQPGSATAGYRAMVDEAYAAAERQKARVDPMYHDKIDALVDRYARKLAENLNERNVIDARVPSILISGGGNFPVAKKHKQNAARDRNYGEYAEISKLLDKIRSVGMGGISADDDLAVEKLTKKLEGLESQQTTMKEVNAYFRKHKTLDGCPELTPEQAEKLKADMAQSWHLDKSKPYPAYLLSNNNANIRRVRQRIEELSSRSEFAGWTFPGGEAKINEAENRLQLIFEEKPDADQRQELKSNGFKWAPSQGAWQRQLNQNAIRAAARIDFLQPKDGTSPYQLQPFVKRENKEMSR